MRVHFQRDIDRLKQQLLSLGAVVESEVRMAVRAIEERDMALAEQVIRHEAQADVLEVNVEEECLKILALHQPVAADLRYVISVLKINQDLERIGDLAVHIAERGTYLFTQPPVETSFRIGEMAEKAQAMLKKVLDAFVSLDADAARAVCMADADIDQINRDISKHAEEKLARDPGLVDGLLQVINIARHLERIADHATNIAEDLIYMIEGRIVRHSPEVSDKPPA
jgi:phosphate transport system protein